MIDISKYTKLAWNILTSQFAIKTVATIFSHSRTFQTVVSSPEQSSLDSE